MKYKIFNEITFSILLVVLGVLFLDPFMFFMPSSVVYILCMILIASFAIFAGLVWREKGGDEREELHSRIAGRTGYLVGLGVLLIGLIWQASFLHAIDPWLVYAFIGMVVGKLLSFYFVQKRY